MQETVCLTGQKEVDQKLDSFTSGEVAKSRIGSQTFRQQMQSDINMCVPWEARLFLSYNMPQAFFTRIFRVQTTHNNEIFLLISNFDYTNITIRALMCKTVKVTNSYMPW